MPSPHRKDFEIGPSTGARRFRGMFGYVLLFAIFGGAFIYLFYMLTLSWKIALGGVTFLVSVMVLTGWWAERSASGSDHSMR